MKKEFIFLFMVLFFSFLCSAQEDINLSVEDQSRICILESKQLLSKLKENNISIHRINDTLNEMKVLYDRHVFLKEKKGNYDFSLVVPYCNEIKSTYNLAIISKDELAALEKFYSDFLSEDLNTSSADILMEEIREEFYNERYEMMPPLVEEAYDTIIEVEASQRQISLIYKSTAKGIKDFFVNNWIYISSFFVSLLLLFFIYRKTILRWNIKRKIKGLEFRREIIKKLIKKTQSKYFEKGDISKELYEVKTKKFSELVLDINRQIPLLKEELAKLGRSSELKDIFKNKNKKLKKSEVLKKENDFKKTKTRKKKK